MGVQGPLEYTVQATRSVQAVWVEQHAVQLCILLSAIHQHLKETLWKMKLQF